MLLIGETLLYPFNKYISSFSCLIIISWCSVLPCYNNGGVGFSVLVFTMISKLVYFDSLSIESFKNCFKDLSDFEWSSVSRRYFDDAYVWARCFPWPRRPLVSFLVFATYGLVEPTLLIKAELIGG